MLECVDEVGDYDLVLSLETDDESEECSNNEDSNVKGTGMELNADCQTSLETKYSKTAPVMVVKKDSAKSVNEVIETVGERVKLAREEKGCIRSPKMHCLCESYRPRKEDK